MSISYQSETVTLEAISLETEITFSRVDDSTSRLEFYANMDKTSEPQISTITIDSTLPTNDAYYRIAIDASNNTMNADLVYVHEFLTASGDTAAIVAAKIARILDTNPAVAASVAGAVITLTAVEPGTAGAFTVTVSCLNKSDNSTVSNKIATANTQVASGTSKRRKLAKLDVKVQAATDKTLEIRAQDGVWYDGSAAANSAGSFGPIPFKGTTKLDALRAVS